MPTTERKAQRPSPYSVLLISSSVTDHSLTVRLLPRPAKRENHTQVKLILTSATSDGVIVELRNEFKLHICPHFVFRKSCWVLFWWSPVIALLSLMISSFTEHITN